MHNIVIALLVALTSLVSAEDDLRSGSPKDCHLFSWGKGPNWTAKVSSEFRLSLLDRQMPYVDDQYFEPTGKALSWIERQTEPIVTTIAAIEGRKIIQVIYPEAGGSRKNDRDDSSRHRDQPGFGLVFSLLRCPARTLSRPVRKWQRCCLRLRGIAGIFRDRLLSDAFSI